ncbi:hypothetical protein TH53_06895 [Pedobacter lusitanus]|uniref:Outer membrane protein beta-barrel domain-containing protein n=1 Tax=Pedobacter lusitanus TaxID=1503925 RepID=A0A0D0F8A4_9SPHI|nr:outer membrane beta-barrel family protein [Pedobacter lusitanus]KIO77858.1 hypothetical protein TH53_06895 [Pedobacter lusitanus]
MDGNLAKRNAISNSNTLISHTPGLTDSSLVASNNQNRTSNILSYNTNYRYADSTGKEFTINGNYLTFKLRDGSYQPNTYYNGNSQFLHSNIYANNAATDIGIISLKSDYQQKLWNGVFSAGAKWMRTQADNDFIFYNVINDNYIPDQGKTNRFLYKEYVTAAYIDYHIKNKKWELQTGLRAEQTIARGNLKSLSENQGEVVNNSYLNLFPNIIFTYYPNTNNTVTLLYNKRIDRPAYQDLNPFVYVQDEYSFLKGNPFLLPQVTETYKIAHIFKQMLTTSFSYSETKDYIVSYRDTIMGGRTYQTNINIDNQRNYNLSVFLQLSPKTWWDFNSSLNAFHQTVNGKAGNTRLNMSQNSWSFTGSNNFRLPDNWSAEISFYYNSKYLDAPAIVNSQWSTDLGIQKKNIKVFRYNPIDSIRFI